MSITNHTCRCKDGMLWKTVLCPRRDSQLHDMHLRPGAMLFWRTCERLQRVYGATRGAGNTKLHGYRVTFQGGVFHQENAQKLVSTTSRILGTTQGKPQLQMCKLSQNLELCEFGPGLLLLLLATAQGSAASSRSCGSWRGGSPSA